MNNAIIILNTDAKLKSKARKILNKKGLTLTIALDASLRKIVREKGVKFIEPEISNTRFGKGNRQCRKGI